MKTRRLNRWNVNCQRAARIQERLCGQLLAGGDPTHVRLVAGADVSYERDDNRFYAGIVVMEMPEFTVIEEVTTSGEAAFPYVPGFLTFREGPILLKAFRKLKNQPDIVIFDGQGIAHPRGIGLAAHIGLILDVPSIGCAKSLLCGSHEEVAAAVTSSSEITYNDEVVGAALRTKKNVKPVFVSVGHLISLKSAIKWVLKTCRGYRLCEPTRQAHLLVNRVRLRARERSETA